MAESLGEACLDLCTDNAQANRGIDETKAKAESLDQTFVRIGNNLAGFGDRLTTRVSLPLGIAAAAAFKLGADAAEAGNKFEVVMGGAADTVRAQLKDLEATIPLTTGEFLDLAAGVQDMLVPMGLARDAGAQMSAQMIELAGDIAAFNNTTPAQVIDDMKSALAGSSEPLFKYGVDTRVAALESVALANGLIEQGEALDNATRAQAVLLQIQNQSTDAMGAAAREAGGAAQSTQFLFREVKQLGEEIGQVLIPIFVPMIQGLRDVVSWFRTLSPETQAWLVKIGLLVAAVGPLLSIIGRVLAVGGKIAGMMAANTAATAANTAANTANAASATSLTSQLSGLGKGVAAVGAAYAGWQIGSTINDELERQGWTLANLLDSVGFYGESIQEIVADTNEAAVAHGEYRTAAQIAADEAARQAAILADELTPALVQQTTEQTAAATSIARSSLELEKFEGTATPATRAMWALANSAKAAADEFEDLSSVSVDWPNVLPPASAPALIDTLDRSMERWGVQIPNVATELDSLTVLVRSGQVPQAQLARILQDTGDKYDRLGVLTRDVKTKLRELTKEAGVSTSVFGDFFGGFKTGIGAIDSFISQGLGKLSSALGGLFGGGGGGGGIGSILGGIFGGGGGDLLSSVKSLFGGEQIINVAAQQFGNVGTGAASGFLGGLSGILGKVSSFLPIIGPLLSAFGGPLLSGLKALGGKIWGGLKSIFSFGGPSAAEKEGRSVAASFRDTLRSELDADSLAQIKLHFPDEIEHAAFLASIQQKLIAAGVAAEAAGVQAQQWGTKLFEAEKQGGSAVQNVIDQITAATQAAIEGTSTTATEAAKSAAQVAADYAAAQQKILNDASLSATEQQKILASLAIKHEETMRTMVSDTSTAQNQIATVGISAAEATEKAWVSSATRTAAAWAATRQLTVGSSSITDIETLGSAAAHKLGDAQVDAARRTESEWERVNHGLSIGGGAGGFKGDDFRSGDFGARSGGGNFTIVLEVDGERMARKVVRLTPEILRKLGLQ